MFPVRLQLCGEAVLVRIYGERHAALESKAPEHRH